MQTAQCSLDMRQEGHIPRHGWSESLWGSGAASCLERLAEQRHGRQAEAGMRPLSAIHVDFSL